MTWPSGAPYSDHMTALSNRTGGRVTAEEASEHLAELLEHVREGATYTITCDGRAVATLEPAEVEPTQTARDAAWQRLMEHLDTVQAVDAGTWTRDELYER